MEYFTNGCHPFLFRHHHHWKRRFLTEEEREEMKKRHKEGKIKWMERYREYLERELKGVNERLEKIKEE
jgi:hypothetical protein